MREPHPRRVVLVTGVSRYLGHRFARLVQDDPAVARVLCLDPAPPWGDLGAAELVPGDLRTAGTLELIERAGVDTVVHMGVIATPASAGGRSSMKEINVIATMQLLAACQRAPGVRRVVVKSSSAVYGSSARDPALFTEDMEPKELPPGGFAKDSVEVEGYVRGFARRRPDAAVTLLRFANFVGPGVDSPLTAYFSLPVWPAPLGYDARLQLVHEDDGLEMIRRAAVGHVPGIFNVAGDGVLRLSQAARRAGRPVVALPGVLGGLLGRGFRRAGVADFSPEQMRFLTYGRGLDCTRMRTVAGFTPRFSTVGAFDDFLARRGLHRLLPVGLLDDLERGVREGAARERSARA